MNKLKVINAIIVNDKKEVLCVFEDLLFKLPGGRSENSENELETLRRELKEELKLNLVEAKFFENFVFETEEFSITLVTYLAHVSGEIVPSNEIKEYKWVNKEFYAQSDKFLRTASDQVFRKLRDEGIAEII